MFNIKMLTVVWSEFSEFEMYMHMHLIRNSEQIVETVHQKFCGMQIVISSPSLLKTQKCPDEHNLKCQ